MTYLVKAAFDKAKFGVIVDSMRLAAERKIEGDPIKAVFPREIREVQEARMQEVAAAAM